jgi:FKBP-type peptidyl-prolyl cis-trans isomerase
MKQSVISLLAIFLLFGCNKNSGTSCDPSASPVAAPSTEVDNLQNYITTSGINAIKHPKGFFYEIISAGTGTGFPTICSTVAVTYIGTVIGGNGTPFDSNTTGISFALSNLIGGWQLGIPLLKKGGSIRLYLPPSLAYGASGGGSSIPPNSYLLFNVALIDFQN